MKGPYAVPDDSCTPYPVDFTRLMDTLHSMGYRADVLVADRAAGGVFDGIPFLFSFDSTGRFLSVRAVWDTGLDASTCRRPLFAAADGWNREKYFPTLYHMDGPEGGVQVCADFVVDTRAGLTDDQLAENIGAGLSTGISAIEYMKQAGAEVIPGA